MTRKNAFLIHLGVSLLIFIALLLLIIYRWYPAPYFDMSYRQEWIQLIAFVDVVLGPGLTLLVYKQGKPSLKFDMSVIVIVQTVALSWGVWNAWMIHPVSNVYYENRISCYDSEQFKFSGANAAFKQQPVPDRIISILPKPQNASDSEAYIAAILETKNPAYKLGDRLVEASAEKMQYLVAKQDDFAEVVALEPAYQKEWERLMKEHGEADKNWRYLALSCADNEKTAVYDISNNRIVSVLNIKLPLTWVLR